MRYIDTYDWDYNGQKLIIHLHYFDGDGRKIEFDYNKQKVSMFFYDTHNWYNVVTKVCMVIDKVGIDGFEKYKQFEEDIKLLMMKYIILEDNVYKPNLLKLPFGAFNRYVMNMKMADNKVLSGEPLFSDPYISPEHREEFSEQKTFNNLVNRVIQYYKSNNVLPSNEHLDRDKTKELKKIKQWYKENGINSLYI